jgi:tetratricopeptide (TPR) repeat protein
MRRLRWMKYLFLAAVIFLTACQPPGPRALLDGERLIRDGKYPEAIVKLQKATNLLPKNAQAWNHLGLAYQYAGKPDEALKAYQEAVKLDRNLAPVRYNLGILHLEQGRLNEAINELTTCTVLDRSNVSAQVNLAKAWLRARRVEEADQALREALKLEPKNVEALNYYGVTLLHRRKASDARDYFNAALRLQPDYSPAVLNQAVLSHYYIVNKSAALAKYREYLAMKPDAAGAATAMEAVRVLEAELQPKTATAPVTTAATNAPSLVATNKSVAGNTRPPAHTNALSVKTNLVSAPHTNAPVVARPAPTNVVETPVVQTNKPVAVLPNKAPEVVVAPPVKTNVVVASLPPAVTNEAPKVVEKPEEKVEPPKPLEVVSLDEEPKLAVAKDITPAPKPAVVTPKPAPVKPVEPPKTDTNVVAKAEELPPLIRPARREESEKSTSFTGKVLKKANPVNWFRKDKDETKTEPKEEKIVAARPVNPPKESAVKELPELPREETREAPPVVKPEPVFARYPYQSTALPVAGKRAAAEPLFNEAVAAHREGKLGKAMDGYRAALRQDPRFFDAQLNLGIAAAQATDLSLALASLEDAVRLEPRSAEARYQFAMALRRANYPLDAALELKTLTEDWPNEARAYLALGNLCSQVLNKPAEAATNYQKVLELAPQHPQGPQIRAWLARQQ